MTNRLRHLIRDTLIGAVIFFMVAGISLYLTERPEVITKLWLPNVIGIMVLLRYAIKDWPIFLVGIGAANYLAYILFGYGAIDSGYFTVINGIEIILTVSIFKYYDVLANFDHEIKSAFVLVFTVMLIAPAISATQGALLFSSHHRVHLWMNWFVGDGICMTIVVPVSLCLIQKCWLGITKHQCLDIFLWTLLTVGVIVPTVLYLPYAFIMIVVPLLMVAIFRSVFQTILIACFNIGLIFTLYNARIYVPLIHSTIDSPIFIYIPITLLFMLPYFLSLFMAILKKTKDKLSHSESLFRSAMESSGVGMALVSKDGGLFMVNDALCRMLGYSKEKLTTLKVQNITYVDDLPQTIDILKKLKQGDVELYNTEKRYVDNNNNPVWVRLSVTPVRNEDKEPQYYVAHIEDINQNKKLELANVLLTKSLYDEKEHLQVLLTSIADSVIATDEQGCITFMNPAAEKTTGWDFEESKGLANHKVFMIVDEDNHVLKSPIDYCLKHKTSSTLINDAIFIKKTGVKSNIKYSISLLKNKDKKIIGSEVVFQDVTHEKSLQKELSYNATHDSLTGLLNRREFERILNQYMQEFKSKGTQYILCYLDLDFFKIINDSSGHVAGDAFLQRIANLFRQRLRKTDVLARLGGDEFGILLLNDSLIAAKKVCQQLIDMVNSISFQWNNKTHRIGVSIGMVLMSDDMLSASQLLSAADMACYSAKAEGRNQLFVYKNDKKLSLEKHHGVIIANAVQDAFENNRFVLYAQKIIPVNSKTVINPPIEILLRMVNEQNEIIEANAFVVTAERFNLMASIDRWVLIQLLEKYDQALSKLSPMSISINLSANSLNSPGFLDFLLPLIKKSALPPERLCFEITETAAMNHIDRTINIVRELQRIRCKISLDDFGVGLSSFSYVKSFSVDFIKIDGSFIKNLVNSDVDKTIVQTINDMAHRLGIQTIAEYVETKKILTIISDIGVDYAQGYAIGRPMPLTKIIGKNTS